ncbi:MAG: GNAT family N-acetyltransferase [Bacteroidetes bacterium]|nr:GNAT family N-acetyltransferase [Bacteroidota bacterium]
MIPPLYLESSRLIIRPFKLSDASSLFHLVNSNKDLLEDYFPMTVEKNTSVNAKRIYIMERNHERNNGKALFAGIFLRDEKKLIGQMCAKDINHRVPKCEAGYFLDRNFHRKGLATEALNLFLNFCFSEMKMAKITLRIEPKNTSSKALAQKCGFTMIGVSKNDFRSANGRLMECELWELYEIRKGY